MIVIELKWREGKVHIVQLPILAEQNRAKAVAVRLGHIQHFEPVASDDCGGRGMRIAYVEQLIQGVPDVDRAG